MNSCRAQVLHPMAVAAPIAAVRSNSKDGMERDVLLDHLIGLGEQKWRNGDSQRPNSLEVQD